MFGDESKTENAQEVTLLEPGVHRMKVSSHTVTDNGWSLTFKKGSFHVNGFGDNPYLKAEDGAEVWMKRVGGWLVGTKTFFGKIMSSEEVNQIVEAVRVEIKNKYPTLTEQYESVERVRESVKALTLALLSASDLYFKSTWFDVTLEPGIYLDDEGNEKATLKLPKKTVENGYYSGYKISEDQSDPVEENPTDKVPDWVNEEPTVEPEGLEATEVSPRTEPSDVEW